MLHNALVNVSNGRPDLELWSSSIALPIMIFARCNWALGVCCNDEFCKMMHNTIVRVANGCSRYLAQNTLREVLCAKHKMLCAKSFALRT